MGFLPKKIFPKKSPVIVEGVSNYVSGIGHAVAPGAVKKPAPTPVDAENLAGTDEPTIFTTFMVLYYGFFGLTLLINPSLHAMDGPFTNPMAYWTTIDDDLAFAFRLAGACFLTLVLGPFTDELFGGVGVQMKAFTEQMFIANLLAFFIFVYYGFWSPLDTAVSFMWRGQAVASSVILAWNLIELVTGTQLKAYYSDINAALYGFFGITLVAAPKLFFGPGSPVAYWTVWDDLSLFTARSLGFGLLAIAGMGFYYMSKDAFCKQMTFFNLVNIAIFIEPAFGSGKSSVDAMWEIQLVINLFIALVGVYLELSGTTGGFPCSFSCPSCGANVASLNLFNVFWFGGFAAGFLYGPNELFGPTGMAATMMGQPMFTVDGGETATWFAKAWALTELTIVLGPYIFGCAPTAVCKQTVVQYLIFPAMFAYGLYAYEIFNATMVIPLAAFNFILFIIGIYAVWPTVSGEAML
jgi:hypothetical protein